MIYLIIVSLLIIGTIIALYKRQIAELKKKHSLQIGDLESKLGDEKSTLILRELLEVPFEKETISRASKKIVYILMKSYPMDFCTIYVNTNNRLRTCATNVATNDTMADLEYYVNLNIGKVESIGGKKAFTDKGYLSYVSAADRKVNFSFLIPLKANETLLGAVLIENTNYNDKNNEMGVEFFKVAMDTIAITFQNLIFYDKIVSMATKDALTKMHNRRQMDTVLNQLIADKKKFAVAMMDIDHFKKFNDTYGHSFGDLVLIQVSKFIKNQVKGYGQVFRYGGEEFLISFFDMNSTEAFERLDKIRQGIETLTITNENNVSSHVTASFGISEYPKNTTTDANNLKELADQALYYSKEHGRNRITIYNDMLK
jgi:two-component system cell cycle response regulator